jgi:hypothetical protein
MKRCVLQKSIRELAACGGMGGAPGGWLLRPAGVVCASLSRRGTYNFQMRCSALYETRYTVPKISPCRQFTTKQSVLATLALHALKPRMKKVFVELSRTVALRKRLSQGRQWRAFDAWLHLASALRWRRQRMKTLCWLAWQAQAVAARRTLRKAKQHYHIALVRCGMRAWKVVYTQVSPCLLR